MHARGGATQTLQACVVVCSPLAHPLPISFLGVQPNVLKVVVAGRLVGLVSRLARYFAADARPTRQSDSKSKHHTPPNVTHWPFCTTTSSLESSKYLRISLARCRWNSMETAPLGGWGWGVWLRVSGMSRGVGIDG
jgi:hypothetical protein